MIEDELIAMKVFYSYASKDQALRDELENHLGNLRRQGIITSWSNRNINAGQEWKKTIDAYLDEADIILLLVSSDFISSDYCYSVELQRALERQRSEQAEVLPILLRPVDWEASPFSHLPVLPTNAKPVNTWPNLDEAFVEVVKGIKQVTQERIVRKYLQRGQEWLSDWQPEKALIACEKAIQIDRTAHVAFAFKGNILLSYFNHYEEALAAYQQASKLKPTVVTYFMKIGDLLSDESYEIKNLVGHYRKEAALAAYQRVHELEPTNAAYLMKMGDLLYAEKALAAYRQASELEPTNASYFIKIGDIIARFHDHRTGGYEEALAAYHQASELDPTNASYLVKIGNFLKYDFKRIEEALVAYQRASELEPTNASHHDSIGDTLCDLHRYEESIIAYQQASELEPTNASYHRSTGNILEILHRYEEAIVAYRQASEVDPTEASYHATIGDIFLNHLKVPRKALAAYRQASTLKPNEEGYYEKIGDVLLDYLEKSEEAFAAYRQASECDEYKPSYYEKQAKALEKWARELRNRAIELRRN